MASLNVKVKRALQAYFANKTGSGGGGGSGFTPTPEQQQAMDSGITSTILSNIENDIDNLKEDLSNFIGNFATHSALLNYSGELSNNDYAVVESDETHNNECWRYIYNKSISQWKAQYKVNNSPINTEDQDSNPNDTDSLSDLNGTTNKRWTFVKIWNWVVSKLNTIIDNTTIALNDNKLEVKNSGISKDKLNSNVADNNTIEKDSSNGLRLKDGGITFKKFNSDLTKQSLVNDYYFKFSDSTNIYYTKTIVNGENIDVYVITITNNKITAITLQETKGTLANGVLTFSGIEYAHYIFGDGFYVVGDDEILITISALQDILEKAGKVNDVKIANKSIIENKEANIETIDNVEDNFYYAFKNGSTYYYTKSKAEGSTAYYQFTYIDNVLTKIENKGNVTVELNANRIPQITISSVAYALDETKNDYYIINPKQKLPSIENEVRDLTKEELNRIFEGFYITPPNPSWKYVGILPASNGSTLKVEDDWNELLLVARVSEGSAYYNLTSIIPKYGFTYGNPNGNNTFAGFFWNESYNCKMRVGLEGTGANRVVKQNYLNQVGWALNGIYVFKR